MLKAGIDIGTNTILLLVADVEGGKVLRVLEDHVKVVRLGQSVDQNRAFHPDAMERARACFREYAEVLKKYPHISCRAVATSGSRDAKNSSDFFAEITRSTGIKIDVISGEEEALLSFRGSVPGNASALDTFAVLDIGGGSTEIVGLEEGKKADLFRYSFNIGCVRLTERFLKHDPAEREELSGLRAYVQDTLSGQREIFTKVHGRSLIAVAGTPTYIASAALDLNKFDPEKIHGYRLTRSKLNELTERFSRMTTAERLGLGGMDQGRADVITTGAIILSEVMELADLKDVLVSVRGLRYGIVLS